MQDILLLMVKISSIEVDFLVIGCCLAYCLNERQNYNTAGAPLLLALSLLIKAASELRQSSWFLLKMTKTKMFHFISNDTFHSELNEFFCFFFILVRRHTSPFLFGSAAELKKKQLFAALITR